MKDLIKRPDPNYEVLEASPGSDIRVVRWGMMAGGGERTPDKRNRMCKAWGWKMTYLLKSGKKVREAGSLRLGERVGQGETGEVGGSQVMEGPAAN